MKIPPALQILSVWLVVAILGAALTMTRASADVVDDDELVLIDEPALSPKSPKAAEPTMTTNSTSQCGSGYFCVWTQANYSGTIQRFSSQSQYLSISLYRAGSFYNNRSKRVFLYGDSSGSPSSCFGARSRGNLSGWQNYAVGTYLSTATSC